MTCTQVKAKCEEKSTCSTLRLYLLLQAWLRKQKIHESRPIIIREWFID